MTPLQILFLVSSSCSLFSCSQALAKNVTRYIDDTYGDLVTGTKPSYFPTGSNVWQDQTCEPVEGCLIVPDTQQTYNGTYHAATYRTTMHNMGFSLAFRGTSVSVYFILANDDYIVPVTTLTECKFILDGSLRKSYAHKPVKNKGTEYNVGVYREDGLDSDQLHTLRVETGRKDYEVYLAFDYATYTVEEPDDSHSGITGPPNGSDSGSSRNLPIGAIIGGVVGGLVVLIGALLVFLMCQKRRQSRHIDKTADMKRVSPFMAQTQQVGEPSPHRSNKVPVPHSGGIPSSGTISDYPSDPNRNPSDTVNTPELTSLGTGADQMSAPTPASGLSKAAMLRRQERRGELSALESRGHDGNNVYFPPPHSGTTQTGLLQGEVAELRDRMRELRAQILPHLQENSAALDTPPPMYT